MIEFYTSEYVLKCKHTLKKEREIQEIVAAVLLCTAVLSILFRDKTNHIPSLIVVCLVWILGIWFLMFRIMQKTMPLKRDIVFCNKMMNSSKKEVKGKIVECRKTITMYRMNCYHLVISTDEGERHNLRQVYLDKRFATEQVKEGNYVMLQVAQHFVFAIEEGGNAK